MLGVEFLLTGVGSCYGVRHSGAALLELSWYVHRQLCPHLTCPPPSPPPQGDRLYSELFNELYQFNLDSRRWFPVALRPPKKTAKAEAASEAEAAASSSGDGGAAPDQQATAAATTAAQQQQGQEGLPAGVSPEMHAMLQRMLADKGGALHSAAARIQANFRGYRVRQVCGSGFGLNSCGWVYCMMVLLRDGHGLIARWSVA